MTAPSETESRSSLPLHPGERLEREFDNKHLYLFLFAAGGVWGLLTAVILAWICRAASIGWIPEAITAALIVSTLYTAYEYRRASVAAKRLLFGARGEREVAAILADLRAYRAFHNVVLPGLKIGNIDHVLVGPAGVFAIETKNRRGCNEAPPRVVYDGHRLTCNGFPLDPDPIAQVNRNAAALSNWIVSRVGRKYWVRGVVLFPGAEIVKKQRTDVWVLRPERLRAWIGQEERRAFRSRERLDANQIDRIVAAIASACQPVATSPGAQPAAVTEAR